MWPKGTQPEAARVSPAALRPTRAAPRPVLNAPDAHALDSDAQVVGRVLAQQADGRGACHLVTPPEAGGPSAAVVTDPHLQLPRGWDAHSPRRAVLSVEGARKR